MNDRENTRESASAERVEVLRNYRSVDERIAEDVFSSGSPRIAQKLLWKAGGRRRAGYARAPFKPSTLTIGVGNIAFGGRGKTPFAIGVAKHFLSAGKRVAIIHKYIGPRNQEQTECGYSIGSDPLNLIGDESALVEYELWKHLADLGNSKKDDCTVVAARNKVGAVKELDSEGFDALIIDDAFQLTGLEPQHNFALVCPDDIGLNGFGFAPLREPPSSLSRATNILLDVSAVKPANVAKIVSDANEILKEFNAPHVLATFRYIESELVPVRRIVASVNRWKQETELCTQETGFLAEKRVLCFSGIANPAAFECSIAGLGARNVFSLRFSDHHRFAMGELLEITELADDCGADTIVTTMKDACRIALSQEAKVLTQMHETKDESIGAWALRIEPDYKFAAPTRDEFTFASILD
ncbi:tetraacyldisaccharide 4'-kinase [bacterium]|nr:tetraacyldisaccharide 4'-kinase [bacterium]